VADGEAALDDASLEMLVETGMGREVNRAFADMAVTVTVSADWDGTDPARTRFGLDGRQSALESVHPLPLQSGHESIIGWLVSER